MAPHDPKNLEHEDADDSPAAETASKRFSRKHLVVGILGTALIAGSTYFVLKPTEAPPDPAKYLDDAFLALDNGKLSRAKALSEKVISMDYRDPDFSGAPEFILGMASYQTAIDPVLDEVSREQAYQDARKWLKDADKHIIAKKWRPVWAFAYGKSLFYSGSAAAARPALEEAVATYREGRVEATLIMTEIYLDTRKAADLELALKINADILANPELSTEERDKAHMQLAQIYLSQHRHQDAIATLEKLSTKTSSNLGTQLFKAQTYMSEERYQEAIELLIPVAQNLTTDQDFARHASYLLGVCREKLHDDENAVVDYQRTANRFRNSQEGIAALLRAAALMRKNLSNEKSLAAYRSVLASVGPVEDYRNRWLSLKELQDAVIEAWNDWVQRGVFQEAIDLSESMAVVLSEVAATEYSAEAHHMWAEHLQRHYDAAPPDQRESLIAQVREHWNLSGYQHELLAEAWKTSPRYSDAIRLSAEHYRMGHEFEKSLELWERFIDVQPPTGMPNAYIRMGEVLMDLDRFDDALANFELVMKAYPTDASRFTAEYLSGICHLERNELEQAERIWRSILTKGDLAPSAREWRLSLFSLGQFLSNHSDILRWQAGKGTSLEESAKSTPLLEESFLRSNEAILRLEEYVKRYPKSAEITQARFLLAHSLQHAADQHRRKYTTAETENARQEQLKAMREQLRQTIVEYTQLKTDLIKLDGIDPPAAFMLRECFFEIAHTHYGLEEYEEAITAYTAAANRYPQDARAVLAYLQMTRCYEKLGKPTEARSKLEQVKYILEGLPDDVFQPQLTNLTKAEWQDWVEWAIRLYQQERPDPQKQPADNRLTNNNEPAS
ncbi:MAG: tetratricopeptide repeat protein [Planctomycetaceae bacterium]